MGRTIFQPAYAAVRAEIFTPELRNAANSLNQISEQIARLIGPSLGGLIVSFTSVSFAFGLDTLTFAISIISLLFLKTGARQVMNGEIRGVRFFIKEIMGGYYELRKHTWLWVTIIAFLFINIAAGGIISVLLPWLIKINLSLFAYQYGILISTSSLGSLVSGVIFSSRSLWRHRGIVAYTGIGIQGLALLSLSFIKWFPGLLVLMFINGAGVMLFGLIWEISLQELVPPEAYGRVISLDMFGSWALLPVGYLLTGLLARQIGGRPTIMIEAAVIIMIAISMLFVP